MYATVHATVLPGFSVEVWPICEKEWTRQGYVLIVRDGTLGTVELVFPSAQDLQAFLTMARAAFAAARDVARARKDRRRQPLTAPPDPTIPF